MLDAVRNPIGIADDPIARDEYDPYVGRLEVRVLAGAPQSDLRQLLPDMEAEEMGLVPDFRRAERVAEHIARMNRRS